MNRKQREVLGIDRGFQVQAQVLQSPGALQIRIALRDVAQTDQIDGRIAAGERDLLVVQKIHAVL